MRRSHARDSKNVPQRCVTNKDIPHEVKIQYYKLTIGCDRKDDTKYCGTK